MRLFYNIFFSGLFFIPMLINAQDGKLNIDASRSAEGIMLNWVPKSSEVWTENFKTGFNLMRVEIDANGNEKGIPSIISEKILLKTKEWFLTNAKEERGLMEVIGSLLYDKDLVGSDSGVGMSKLDQYNYLMYESKNSNIIAAAIGLSFTDSSAKKDGLYRYTISNISKIKLGSIDISDINRESFQNGGYEYLDFKFPDDKSLSDMLSETEYQPEVESIQTISRAYGDSIVVRWAPTGSTLWMQGMKDGYEVFRKNSAEEEILVATVYPWKSDMFTPAIMVDTMALTAPSIIDGLNKPNKELNP